jgi:spermidine synthase
VTDRTDASAPAAQHSSLPALLGGTPGLITAQLIVSAGALVLEIVGGRMLAPYVGMSLYTWTAVIAVVLAGLSAGHWLGGRIAELPSSVALARTALLLAAAAVSATATLLLLRAFAGPVSGLTSNPVAEISLLATAVFFPPSFFAGVPSPVIASLAINARPDQQGRALGAVFAAGAIGAIAGTLAAGYLFISWLGSAMTTILVGATYAVIALWFAFASSSRSALIFTVIGIAATSGLAFLAHRTANPCDTESRYFCIRTIDISADVGQTARLMVLDHLGHGISMKADPSIFAMAYAEAIDEVTRRRFGRPPASAFFIGGGSFTLPRAWQAMGSEHILVAEIDPAVTDTAIAQFWFEPKTVEVVHEDARRALASSARRFEVIVGDAFTDIAVPQHLITREFFELVKARLADNGLYAMNLIDDADTGRALTAVAGTLKAVFDNVEVFVEHLDLQAGGRTTFFLFASQTPSGIRRFTEPDGERRQFINVSDAPIVARALSDSPLVLTDDYAPIDRLIGLNAM